MTQLAEFNPREFARLFRGLDDDDKRAFVETLPPEEAYAIENLWEVRARENQLAPESDWRFWVILAGRGFGKTLSITQWAHAQAMTRPKEIGAIIAPTADDVRDVLVDGPAGILNNTPEHERPRYSPTYRRLDWPNGSRALLFSAEEPERLRGKQQHWAICDEIAAWNKPDAFTQLLFGLRLGNDPRVAIATTPKPVKHLRDLLKRDKVVVTRGSSYENRANLAEDYFNEVIRPYEGTKIGRQEIEGILFDDEIGALWTSDMIEALRVWEAPTLIRIVIAVDPAVSANEESNETGIIVVGIAKNGHCYVLKDLTIKGSPETWARAVVEAYHDFEADRVVAEVNQGGALVEYTIRSIEPDIPYMAVHASRGKVTRAEPVVSLYEQGKVHHVGYLPMLETQQVEWIPGEFSPDRIDALVWGITDLVFGERTEMTTMRRGQAKFVRRIRQSRW